MFGLGTWELIVILGVAVLLFGAKRLPDLGRGLGEAIRGFKRAVAGEPDAKTLPEDGRPQPPSGG